VFFIPSTPVEVSGDGKEGSGGGWLAGATVPPRRNLNFILFLFFLAFYFYSFSCTRF